LASQHFFKFILLILMTNQSPDENTGAKLE